MGRFGDWGMGRSALHFFLIIRFINTCVHFYHPMACDLLNSPWDFFPIRQKRITIFNDLTLTIGFFYVSLPFVLRADFLNAAKFFPREKT